MRDHLLSLVDNEEFSDVVFLFESNDGDDDDEQGSDCGSGTESSVGKHEDEDEDEDDVSVIMPKTRKKNDHHHHQQRRLHAHRSILCARCSVMKAMLAKGSSMSEAEQVFCYFLDVFKRMVLFGVRMLFLFLCGVSYCIIRNKVLLLLVYHYLVSAQRLNIVIYSRIYNIDVGCSTIA